MIAKFIGYLIGGIFAVGLLAPLGVAVWLIYDRTDVLLSTTLVGAVIEECHYKRVRKGSGYSGSWGPVAVTDTGVRVKGEFTWKKKAWCESGIGDEVTVFIHETDESKNRVNTFFQFWFMPLLFFLISAIFYPGSYIAKKRKDERARQAQESGKS
ncbi:MAG: DUF3592 domain-containing protein [Gammaproteobacteria bacterium]|nr:DUF3592 domain-containing protein [Gammaproteobacteria bacterium]